MTVSEPPARVRIRRIRPWRSPQHEPLIQTSSGPSAAVPRVLADVTAVSSSLVLSRGLVLRGTYVHSGCINGKQGMTVWGLDPRMTGAVRVL
jgi:hypothetical protein